MLYIIYNVYVTKRGGRAVGTDCNSNPGVRCCLIICLVFLMIDGVDIVVAPNVF